MVDMSCQKMCLIQLSAAVHPVYRIAVQNLVQQRDSSAALRSGRKHGIDGLVIIGETVLLQELRNLQILNQHNRRTVEPLTWILHVPNTQLVLIQL